MKFETSSETYKEAGSIVTTYHRLVEPLLKEFFAQHNYGNNIEIWGFIPIIMPQNVSDNGFFKEIIKYRRNKKDVEFRLQIDYDRFLKSTESESIGMIVNKLIESIDIAEKEFKIKDFDFAKFRQDLTDFCKSQGWIK